MALILSRSKLAMMTPSLPFSQPGPLLGVIAVDTNDHKCQVLACNQAPTRAISRCFYFGALSPVMAMEHMKLTRSRRLMA